MEVKIKRRRIISAILVAVLLLASWVVTFTGVGDKFDKLSEQLKYGLDINGGVYVLLEADTNAKGTELTQIMNQTKGVLENRVNAMGISEAQVSIEGDKRIRVEMPGVDNAEEAIKQIGRTAQLKFFLADGTEVLTGEDINDSQMANDDQNGGYKITIDFSKQGSDLFADATEKAFSGEVEPTMTDETGQTVSNTAIVIALDDEVISAPNVHEKISSRSCEITRPGGFTKDEASALSALIRGGALPTNLTEVNSSVQTATIGANALEVSIKAGAIGLGIVLILMLIAYGLLGGIADIALLLYIQLILWIMSLVGVVLTLPGIAGIILSIGMAVDSNVIIFTRIREEIAKGKDIKIAVDSGYHSALSTVIDSQTTTLLAAIILYIFGTTSVKGFALTLMLGTVISILTAVFITQLYVNLLASSKRFSKPSIFGMNEDGTAKVSILTHKFNFNFLDNRKKFYALSLAIMLVGLSFGITKGMNYGIDFKELAPDYKYDESGKYTFKGDDSEVSARFIDPENGYTPEQIEGFVRKIYAATAKASKSGKNVYGFLLSGKSTKEGAMEEKPIDEVLKGGYTEILGVKAYTGSYSWSILKDDLFYDVSVSAIEKKAGPNDDRKPFEYVGRGYSVSINKGLQKSMDDTMKDAEDAFKKIENDPELKKKVQEEAEKVKKQYGL